MDVSLIASEGQLVDDAPRRAEEACRLHCRNVLADLVVRGEALHALICPSPKDSRSRD